MKQTDEENNNSEQRIESQSESERERAQCVLVGFGCSYVQRAPASHTENISEKLRFEGLPLDILHAVFYSDRHPNQHQRRRRRRIRYVGSRRTAYDWTHTNDLYARTHSTAQSMQCNLKHSNACGKHTHTHRAKCMKFGSKICVPKAVYRYSLPNRSEKAERYTTSVFRSGLSPYAHIQQASTSSVIGCALPPARSRSRSLAHCVCTAFHWGSLYLFG